MAKVLSMGAGDVIIKEGDMSDTIYLLQQGRLNVFKKDGAKNVKIGTIEPGELVGTMAFISKKPRGATVIASESSELVVVSRKSFKESIDQLPFWLQAFIKSLMRRIDEHNKL